MSEQDKTPTTEESIAALHEKREKRKAALAAARLEQQLRDLEELDQIEESKGADRIGVFEVPDRHYAPGLPTIIVYQKLNARSSDRFAKQMNLSKDDGPALVRAFADMALQCLIYPSPDMLEKMEDAAPGLKAACGIEVQNSSLVKVKEEKKG